MTSAKMLWTGVALLGLAACDQEGLAKVQQRADRDARYVDGEILVMTNDLQALDAVKKSYAVDSVAKAAGLFVIQSEDLIGWEDRYVQELRATGQFSMVERNYWVSVSERPQDERWLSLWALKNYGQSAAGGSEGNVGADISALQAWDITHGSRDIVVAVLDTGVDYTHPDLADNIWVNRAEASGVPGEDDDGNGYADDVYGWDFVSSGRLEPYHGQIGDPDPMDDYGHGTHVAGTIGAVGNNGLGVVGVNWNVSIMALKFLDRDGGGKASDELRAMTYAANNGVDVINASYGGGPFSAIALRVLKSLQDAGVLFVAAAGNESTDNGDVPAYPASYDVDAIVSVAATDNRDQLAEFSNFGDPVDLAAPGVSILSTYPVALVGPESNGPANAIRAYAAFSGTSMASPQVAGAAALVLAANPSLRKNPVALKDVLLRGVDWMPHLAGLVKTGGRLNVHNAVARLDGGSPSFLSDLVEETLVAPVCTPRFPTERIDRHWQIAKPGARAIQAHIRSAMIDAECDVATIYDGSYNQVVRQITNTVDYWTPVVMGDIMYLKFSNAIITNYEYLGKKVVEDPNTLPPDQESSCTQISATAHECQLWSQESAPMPNYDSEGIVIDRIRYLPGVAN